MLYDLNKISISPFAGEEYDVCIIGGGVAGITLAMYLDQSLKVLLLEGGGLDYSEESQEIYKGKEIGNGAGTWFEELTTRARWLGGGSNYWAGWCRPLDKTDFEKKEWVKYSGWPIKKSDLDPYLNEARSIFNLNNSEKPIYYKGFSDKLENPNENLKKCTFWFSVPHVNFRDKYLDELVKRSNIHCYLNANLTDITLIDNLSSVKAIEVRNYKGNIFNAKAKLYVLATGGIENARLLLNFNKQCKNGIGNNNDLVGRFFADHPHYIVGYFILEDHIKNIFAAHQKPFSLNNSITFLMPTLKFMNKKHILNFGLRIEPDEHLYNPPLHSFKEKLRSIICANEWSQEIYNTIKRDVFKHTHKMYCYTHDGFVRIASDQEPNPQSRVFLWQTEKDKFGMNRPVLNWQLSKIEKRTFKEAALEFSKIFAKLNIGRVHLDKWVLNEEVGFTGFTYTQETGGRHHIGTTRMADSAKNGVVDKNLKVFGIDNLYITGSSVFSTPGHSNPTFTIVQITLRLAEYLNKNFKYITS